MTVIQKIPEEDHLMRLVPRTRQIRDPDDDSFIGISYSAFRLRDVDEGCLSTTWVEFYGPKTIASISKAGKCVRLSQKSEKIPASAYFAIGQVESLKVASLQYGRRVRVVHAPETCNPGHVEIRQLDDENLELLEVLASQVFCELVPVSSLNLK